MSLVVNQEQVTSHVTDSIEIMTNYGIMVTAQVTHFFIGVTQHLQVKVVQVTDSDYEVESSYVMVTVNVIAHCITFTANSLIGFPHVACIIVITHFGDHCILFQDYNFQSGEICC